MALVLAPGFGFVAASAVAGWLVHHVYMAMGVMKARKASGVKYPTLYASEADCKDEKLRKQYNCTQRAHQNSLENLPSFYALLLAVGLKYPVTSAVGAAFYLLGRILYFNGYATGVPDKRMNGSVMYIGTFTLLGAACKMAYDLISAYKF